MIAGWIGGAVGAITVTALHECLRNVYPGAPRLDKLGEEATAKLAEGVGAEPMTDDQLYYTSMIGDIISNAAYYSGAAAPSKHPGIAGTTLGLLAGIGAVKLPGRIGLTSSYTDGSASRRLITTALYTLGGLVAGMITDRLINKTSS